MKLNKYAIAAAVIGLGITTSGMALQVQTEAEVAPGAAQHFADTSLTKHVNITYNVLSTLIGTLAGSAEFKVAQPFSVGITGAYMFSDYISSSDSNSDNADLNSNKPNWGYYSIGAFATFAFNKNVMASGWLVQPTVSYANLSWDDTDTYTNTSSRATASGLQLAVPFIYQWMWDGGFNMRLGIGPSYNWVKSSATRPDGSVANGTARGLGITGMFTIGYAF